MSLLPTKKSPRIIDINKVSALIHGPQKIGKSEWCSQIENVLALLFEPGWTYIEGYKININEWLALKKIYEELKNGGWKKYGGLCVDTTDLAYDRCAEWVCSENGVKHQSDMGYGKGWNLISTEFRTMLTNLSQLPIPLFLISHSKEIEVETSTEKYFKTVPSLSEAPRRTIMGLVDIVMYFTVASTKGGKTVNVIRTKPHKRYEAGDRTNLLPNPLEMKYSKFEECFINK